jgi:excisionase family DNA binding protein
MDMLGIGKNAAYELVKSGKFHCVKVGNHYRVPKSVFDKWLTGNGGDDQ